MMSFLLPIAFGLAIANVVLGIGSRNWHAVLGWAAAALFAAVIMLRG